MPKAITGISKVKYANDVIIKNIKYANTDKILKSHFFLKKVSANCFIINIVKKLEIK